MDKAKPKNNTIEGLAIEAMLALAAEHFPRPDGAFRITDVRPISSGLLPSCWNRWSSLPNTEQIRFSRLLRVRPDSLGDDRAFLRGVQAVLDEGSAFCWVDRSENDPWLHTWKPVPGKPLLQLADELLNQISKRRREKLPTELVASVGKSVALRSRRTSFLVPCEHVVPNAGDWPTMSLSNLMNLSPSLSIYRVSMRPLLVSRYFAIRRSGLRALTVGTHAVAKLSERFTAYLRW